MLDPIIASSTGHDCNTLAYALSSHVCPHCPVSRSSISLAGPLQVLIRQRRTAAEAQHRQLLSIFKSRQRSGARHLASAWHLRKPEHTGLVAASSSVVSFSSVLQCSRLTIPRIVLAGMPESSWCKRNPTPVVFLAVPAGPSRKIFSIGRSMKASW
jgi:hypothetical protein